MANRRAFLTRLGAFSSVFALGGCFDLSTTTWWPKFLSNGETLNKNAQRHPAI